LLSVRSDYDHPSYLATNKFGDSGVRVVARLVRLFHVRMEFNFAQITISWAAAQPDAQVQLIALSPNVDSFCAMRAGVTLEPRADEVI
jgi:hypothetical protein